MKYIDEFQDKKIVHGIVAAIKKIKTDDVNLMEVCGTHTMSIFRSGIKTLLPRSIHLISGPGCPVCVTAQSDIDRMIALAKKPNLILTTFGDMLRVPGTESSLEKERARGCDIRMVYSPLDALQIARENKHKEVAFLAVGFETTSPTIASVVSDAKKLKIRNFSIYSCHKLVTPAIEALLDAQEIKLDGFILPGHVSTITGSHAYEFITEKFKIPCVISGFEPIDILESILMLLRQIAQKKPQVQIQYRRVVHPEGNLIAQKLLRTLFTPCDAQWRGLGCIKESGYCLNKTYQDFDAKKKFNLKVPSTTFTLSGVEVLRVNGERSRNIKNCVCGKVLRGVTTPPECKLFGKACTPENPYGPCMVSSEGTCAAWYKYTLR
jgi:hydrogenase expression/formation protein HypD